MRILTSICRKIDPAANRVRLLSSLRVDPSKLIDGLTREMMRSNPAIEEYVKTNFPEAFEITDSDSFWESKVESGVSRKDKLEEVFPLNIRPLVSYLRDPLQEEGTRSSKRLRTMEKMIPGLLYGGDPNKGIFSFQPESKVFIKTPLNVLQAEQDRYYHNFVSRVYDLTLYESIDDTEGTVHRVLPRDLQRHPVHSTVLYCVNFCRYHAGRPIKLPIVYLNEEESPALKRDGFILPLKRYVECFVEDGAPIPEQLDLECTGLRFKEVIRMDRIVLPEGVRFSDRVKKKRSDFIIGVVFGKNRGAAGDDDV